MEDKQHRGLQMAATSVNWARRNERDKDDNINDVPQEELAGISPKRSEEFVLCVYETSFDSQRI